MTVAPTAFGTRSLGSAAAHRVSIETRGIETSDGVADAGAPPAAEPRAHELGRALPRETRPAAQRSTLARLPLRAILAPLLAGLVATSCGVREMHVTTAEDAGEVWIDGHPMGHRDVTIATPRGPATNLEWYRDGQRVGGRVVPLDTPLGYRFPLDYLFEAVLPLPGSWRTEFRIEADPPPPPGGIDLGPYPEGAWAALWHQVRIEALRSRVLHDALVRRQDLRLEKPSAGAAR